MKDLWGKIPVARRLQSYRRRLREVEDLMALHADVLSPGRYFVLHTGALNPGTIPRDVFDRHGDFIRRILGGTLPGQFRLLAGRVVGTVTVANMVPAPEVSPGRFQGALLYRRNGVTKIFDFRRHLILTQCSDDEKFSRLSRRDHRLTEYLPSPRIHEQYSRSGMFCESYIDGPSARDLPPPRQDEVLFELGERYAAYLRSCRLESDRALPQMLLDGADRIPEVPELAALARRIFEEEPHFPDSVPVVNAHGDLNRSNVIVEKADGQIWVIDWERSGFRAFWYDLFHYIGSRMRTCCSEAMLVRYLDGAYDDLFSQVFDAVGLTFDPTQRRRYLAAYLAERLTERVGQKSPGARKRRARPELTLLRTLCRRG